MALREKINTKLSETIAFICRNPLVFVSETDIHALVMSELFQIKELSHTKLYPTGCTIGKNKKGVPSKVPYKTMRIHKEYGHADQDYARSDIVIFNQEALRKIKDPLNLKYDRAKTSYLPPDYIIEFGTEKAANSKEVFKKHLSQDIKKVSASNVQGYVVHIQRNFIKTKSQANKDKYKEYAATLKEINGKVNTKIKLLAILINIGNEEVSIGSKVKLFNGETFKGVNQKGLERAIEKILK